MPSLVVSPASRCLLPALGAATCLQPLHRLAQHTQALKRFGSFSVAEREHPHSWAWPADRPVSNIPFSYQVTTSLMQWWFITIASFSKSTHHLKGGFWFWVFLRFGFMTKIPFPVNFTVTVTEDLEKHQRGKIMEHVEQHRSGSKEFPQLVLSESCFKIWVLG